MTRLQYSVGVSDVAPLREQLAGLPTAPGVYIYRDDADRVLYVGKAKSIRRRVLSYFQAPLRPDEGSQRRRMSARGGLHPKIDDLVERIHRVEVFVTGSESEALILEANLVKRHRPPFNVRLRDDKSYPYIGISLDEEYPRVYFTREKHRRDRLYFGPFSNAYKVRETLSLIGKIFPSRPCEGREPGRPSGVPCLDYHIKRCLAPCVGYISREDYRALIDQIIAFLSGRYRGLERELEEEMRQAAAAQEFERAAAVRNRLSAVRHLMERQFATAGSVGTADVLGIAVDGESANVQVLQVRDGVLQDRQSFFLDTAGAEDEATVLLQFAYEFYAMALAIPSLVVVPQDSDAAKDLEELLSDRHGSRVEVRASARGDKRKLAELASRNARFALDQDRRQHEQARSRRRDALADLQARLDLPAPPARIECYDISNLGETYAVASMVVFEGGAPAKAHYRSFTMRYEGGPDDFARMEEALQRRFARLREPQDDPSFAARPGPGRDRRRQGAAGGRDRGHAGGRGGGRPVGEPGEEARGGVPAGAIRPAAAGGGLLGPAGAPAHPRRGPPLRAAPPPRQARPRHDPERARRPAGGRAGAQGGHPASLRLDRTLPVGQPRGAGGRAGGAVEGGTRGVRPPPQDGGPARGRRAGRGRRGDGG